MEYDVSSVVRKILGTVCWIKNANGEEELVSVYDIGSAQKHALIYYRSLKTGNSGKLGLPVEHPSVDWDPWKGAEGDILYKPIEAGYYFAPKAGWVLLAKAPKKSFLMGLHKTSWIFRSLAPHGFLDPELHKWLTQDVLEKPITLDIAATLHQGHGPLSKKLFLNQGQIQYLGTDIGVYKNGYAVLTSPNLAELFKQWFPNLQTHV